MTTMAKNAALAGGRYVNAVFTGEETKVPEAEAERRLSICKTNACGKCLVEVHEQREFHRCTDCGCWLDGDYLAKTRLATEDCKLGFWKHE